MIPSSGSSPRVWDEAAPAYDEHRRQDSVYSSCLEVAMRAVSRRRGGIVLDAACGTGMTTLPLLARSAIVIAADYSLESLGVLRKKRRAARCTAWERTCAASLSATTPSTRCSAPTHCSTSPPASPSRGPRPS